jgi:hypothetical protein
MWAGIYARLENLAGHRFIHVLRLSDVLAGRARGRLGGGPFSVLTRV